MIDRDDVEEIREVLRGLEPPVLSLYVHGSPLQPREDARAIALRASEGMKAADVPQRIVDRVRRHIEQNPLQARTLAVFADEEDVYVHRLHMELPVMNATTGAAEVRWGEPYTAPLLLAIDDWERYGIVYLDRERWRFFETFLGEIEEIDEGVRAPSSGEIDWYEDAREAHPAYTASRASSLKDDFGKHLADRMHRFFKSMGHEVDRLVRTRGLDRLVLLGPADSTSHFEAVLPRPSRDRVVARLGGLPNPEDTSPARVLEHVGQTLRGVEREREAELLNAIREDGLWGFEACLEAMQQGRLYAVAVPWDQNRTVYEARPSGRVGPSHEAAVAYAPGDEVREIGFRRVLPELAARFGARVDFMRGDNEQRLVSEMDGLAGLTRW